VRQEQLKVFESAFESVARELLDEKQLTRTIETDGALVASEISLRLAEELGAEVWGQGFPAPTFNNHFSVLNQRLVGEKHLKLKLSSQGREFDAMLFNQFDWLPQEIDAVYQLVANEWQGRKELQIYIEHWRDAAETPTAQEA